MAYSQRTNSLVADSLTGTQTFTASDVVITSTDQGNFPKYEGGRRIVAVRVRVVTAPTSANVTLNFLNGTSTFASAAIGTNTAGLTVDATMTQANTRFADEGEPTLNVVGTGTASAAQVYGVYKIWFVEE